MTDKTQPEALRLADALEYCDASVARQAINELRRQHARIAELKARVQELGAMARENRSRRIVELEAQLEAVGAGGVQALSAAPEAIAKLRHLYQNMVNGAVRDTASAKRIAEGLLAPAIEALERATPTAEQQAAPKVALGERVGTIALIGNGSTTLTAAIAPVLAAPQQEAQEPVALLVRKNSWRAGQWEAAPPDSPSYGLAWANQRQYVYAAPQPAPAPLSRDQIREVFMAHGFTIKEGQTDLKQYVYDAAYALLGTRPAPLSDDVVKDAARLDWLALAGPTSICVVIDRPHDNEVEVATDDVTGYGKTLREAIDAARKQGASHD